MTSGKKAAVLVVAVVLVVGILVAAAFGFFTGSGKVRVIPMAEALKRVESGEKVILLDVRTPEEHAAGHLPESMLLELDATGQFRSRIRDVIPDKGATVFLYCRSGRRSQSAAEIMAGLGYTNVYNIGGMNDVPKGAAVRQ